jgi:hypothetical protein
MEWNPRDAAKISEITRLLFIGSKDTASNFQLLCDFNIMALFNVAIDLDAARPDKGAACCPIMYKVGILDGPGNDRQTIALAIKVGLGLYDKGQRFLVHCIGGRSRSVAIVSAVLMLRNIAPKPYRAAVDWVLDKRRPSGCNPEVDPHLFDDVRNTVNSMG